MSGEVGVNNDAFTAAQSALDSSRGEFAGEATSKVASLTAAQTAGKWGVESGPVAARQQYTTALQEIQDAITSLNAEVIAFLSAAGKTQALMGENEQNGIDATQALSEAQLEALDRSLAQAEKEKNSAIAGNSASKVAEAIDIAKVQASDLVGGRNPTGLGCSDFGRRRCPTTWPSCCKQHFLLYSATSTSSNILGWTWTGFWGIRPIRCG